MDKIIKHKLWIIEINFTKLSSFSINYACRHYSNRTK